MNIFDYILSYVFVFSVGAIIGGNDSDFGKYCGGITLFTTLVIAFTRFFTLNY
jgi:hypothetical protein